MKHITIITSALMLLASHASATEFEGRMECKVKSNKVMEIEEGVANEYTGFTDGFVVGDTLILTYGKEGEERTDSLFLRIKNNVSIVPDFMTFIHIGQENVRFWIDDENNGAGFSSKFSDRLYITPDKVSGSWGHSDHVQLDRYYKNDWQGMVTKNHDSKVHFFTLDGRHKKDELEQMIQYVSKRNDWDIITKGINEEKAIVRAKIHEQLKEEAEKAQNVIQLYSLQKQALAKQVDEAKKRIAELEAAQE